MSKLSIPVRAGLAGAALGLLAVLAVPATSAYAGIPTLTATPNPALAGQTVTITPTSQGCTGNEVALSIINEATSAEMDPTVELNPTDAGADDMWSYSIAFDAGTYDVEATCTVTASAGHLAVAATSTFDYADVEVVVNGKTDAPATATTGQTINIANQSNAKCPTQAVILGMHKPDGTTTPLGPVVVDSNGNWSVPFTFATAGTYDVQGACSFNQQQENAGHLAVAGTNFVFFNYLASTIVVSDAVIPAVPETPAATPVVAAANFTG